MPSSLSPTKIMPTLSAPSHRRSLRVRLQEGGYATDPYYASKVISVINEYNLTRFDPMETPGSQKSDAASSETTSEEGEGK